MENLCKCETPHKVPMNFDPEHQTMEIWCLACGELVYPINSNDND